MKSHDNNLKKGKIVLLLENEGYVDYGSLTKTSDYYVRLWNMRQRQLMNEDLCMIIVQFKEASKLA